MSVRVVDVQGGRSLADYEEHVLLAPAVAELRSRAEMALPSLRGRRVWMINSTAEGGGVAEMLPHMMTLLRELGIEIEWAVIGSDRSAFFDLTKRLHNLIHGAGDPRLDQADRELFDSVNRENADELARLVAPDDLVVIHDPQPLGIAPRIRDLGLPLVWRCHIGLDRENEATRAVWAFLEPYAALADHGVFSAPEYVPVFLRDRSSLIRPALDPLSDKNRELPPVEIGRVLASAGLAGPGDAPSRQPVERLLPSGAWVPAAECEPVGFLFLPLVVQISRWDRLKGFKPLLEAFARLRGGESGGAPEIEASRLVLAGPDPYSVADDPEGVAVLEEIADRYRQLEPSTQADVAILKMPQNALLINAIQRSAAVIVQNSLEEGFGLTVAEAMWKGVPVVGSRACGIRQQIEDGVEGRLVPDAEDPEGIAAVLDEVLADRDGRQRMARAGLRRVHREFLIFKQLADWLGVLASSAGSEAPAQS